MSRINKTFHSKNPKIQLCNYCHKAIWTKIEKNRGTCMLCDNKYTVKTKLTDFIKVDRNS